MLLIRLATDLEYKLFFTCVFSSQRDFFSFMKTFIFRNHTILNTSKANQKMKKHYYTFHQTLSKFKFAGILYLNKYLLNIDTYISILFNIIKSFNYFFRAHSVPNFSLKKTKLCRPIFLDNALFFCKI